MRGLAALVVLGILVALVGAAVLGVLVVLVVLVGLVAPAVLVGLVGAVVLIIVVHNDPPLIGSEIVCPDREEVYTRIFRIRGRSLQI